MKTIPISDLVSMDAPGDGWHHIESNDDHRNAKTGIVQVLDNEAMRAIVEAGVPEEGLIVDIEHRSVPGASERLDTAAAGWVRELAAFDDGEGNLQLAARIEWTPPGLALVQGKVYRHFSTVYNLDDPALAQALPGNRVRPLALLGLALTNLPNNWLGQRPITNSRGATVALTNDHLPLTIEQSQYNGEQNSSGGEALLAAPRLVTPQPAAACNFNGQSNKAFSPKHSAAEEPQTNNTPTTMNEIDQIKDALGLNPEATVEDVLAQIAALKQSEAEATDAAADALLNSEGLADLPDEEKEELKKGLATNSGLTMIAIKALKAQRAGAAKTPAPDYTKGGMTRSRSLGTTGSADVTLLLNTASEIQRRERAAGRTCSFWRAKNLAKAQLRKEGK